MRPESPKHLFKSAGGKWSGDGVLIDVDPSADARFDLPAIFGNDHPVELEIGTGKGTFLLARAAALPGTNFIGIEYARTYAYYAADRFNRHGLTNVRMLATDAAEIFRKRLADRSLSRIHIYFPDPWPKRRHNRRRLIQLAFLAEARRTLTDHGQVLIVTDHADYYRHIEKTLAAAEGFRRIDFPKMSDADGEIVGTNFEKKYIAQGRPFYSAAIEKI